MKTELSFKKALHVKVPGMWILFAVALACCAPGVTLAQVFDTNLIVNGNAESGSASTDGNTPAYPNAPGWTLTGNFLVISYDFDVGWPSSTDPGSPTRGSNLFIGGYGRANSSAVQSIDVSEGAAAIDANSVNYSLSGWLGGYDSESDNAKLTITFRNANGTAIGTASIGPVSKVDRASITSMLLRKTEGSVPVGTRTIDVLLQMTYATGVYNDGDADDLSLILSNSGSGQYSNKLYYPHVGSGATWETEICAINTGFESIEGVFRAYTDEGISVSDDIAVTLGAQARREITVGDEFSDPSSIGYIIFESDSENIVGYTKFYIEGKYRVAVPAVKDVNTGDIYVSHIASNSDWWTGVSLVNTTSSSVNLTWTFDNGTTKTTSLAPKEHKAFTISGLFNGQVPSDVHSATITGGNGVVGLELFGSTDTSGKNYLSGVLLKDATTTHMYYPHVASVSDWWTGIVAYNPSSTACTITVQPYTQDGTSLSPQTLSLAGKSKYIGTASDLDLPTGTAWFEIDASNPITGFELFGTNNGKELGGYTGVGISGTSGIFAKIEKNGGWTGIAFVNIDDSLATVTITAHNDSGEVIAEETVALNAHEKMVGLAPKLFSQDISDATYISYSSTGNVVGFQLNGSSDGMMLDGLPGLAGGGTNPFHGSLSGEWNGICPSGTVSGTFAMNIDSDGVITGAYSGPQSGAINGNVSLSGAFYAEGTGSGNETWSGNISIIGETTLNGNGTWFTPDCSGQWSGTGTSAP
jgi:hypothetical protein